MIPPLRALLAVGVVLALGGVAASIARIESYLKSPYALDSNSGIMAFYVESLFAQPDTSRIAQYRPFEFGMEPMIAIAGLFVVLAALALAAGFWGVRRDQP